jgi:diaminopimelate epimerase
LGKSKMKAFQASRRGGVIEVEVTGTRVLLSGQAVMVFAGELMV